MFKKLGATATNILVIITATIVMSGAITSVYTPYVVDATIEIMMPPINKARKEYKDSINTEMVLFKESMEAKYVIQLDSITLDKIDDAVFSGMERYDLSHKEDNKRKERELLRKMDAKIEVFFGVKIPVINIFTGKLVAYEYAAMIDGKLIKYYEPIE